MDCKEHDLSKLAAIEAYEIGTLQFASPVYVIIPTVKSDKLVPEGASGTKISFIRDTAKCVDKSSVSVYGYTHEVSLDWETEADDADMYNLLIKLQNTPHEFVLTYFGGLRRVIRTDYAPYKFMFNDDNGTMKCSATLVNGQGLTLVNLS